MSCSGRARAPSALRCPALIALLLSGCGDDAAPTATGTCGDGVAEPSEACDDGNLRPGDGCDPSCGVERGYVCPIGAPCQTACGDRIVAGDEGCDDGNRTDGDGCSSACVPEPLIGRFEPVTGLDPGAVATSNAIEVGAPEGSLVTATTLGRFDERIVVDGVERGAMARITRGSRVALRMTAPDGFVENRSTALFVGDLRLDWTISTRTSTFAWRAGAFGPCSNRCGMGVRVRELLCVDERGMPADIALCDERQAPPGSEVCEDTSGCTFAYGPWTPWGACVDGFRERTRGCRRQDGVEAPCAACGGECAGRSACDVICSQLSGGVVYCAPSAPGDKVECDRLLMMTIARCRNAGCALAANSSTECRVGGNPGSTRCMGGSVICE